MIQLVFATTGPQSKMGINGIHYAFGNEGNLPWRRIAQDMMNFRSRTGSDPVVMGRKTFESLPRPLPDRFNVVVTNGAGIPKAKNGQPCDHVMSTRDASLEQICRELEADNGTVSIIGGKGIILEAMNFVDKIVHTIVEEYCYLPNDVRFTRAELAFNSPSEYSGWKAIETHWYDTQVEGSDRRTYITESVYVRTK